MNLTAGGMFSTHSVPSHSRPWPRNRVWHPRTKISWRESPKNPALSHGGRFPKKRQMQIVCNPRLKSHQQCLPSSVIALLSRFYVNSLKILGTSAQQRILSSTHFYTSVSTSYSRRFRFELGDGPGALGKEYHDGKFRLKTRDERVSINIHSLSN